MTRALKVKIDATLSPEERDARLARVQASQQRMASLKPRRAARPAVDDDPPPGELHEQIDQLIYELTERALLGPLDKLALEGTSFAAERVNMPIGDPKGEPAVRITNTAPLEFLYHKAKVPIALWQYAAGARFRLDWTASQISPLKSVDHARAAIFCTEAMLKAQRAGWNGKPGGAALRSFTGIADGKLDAMKRLGDAAAAIGPLHTAMARWVLGEEVPLTRLAKVTGKDPRVIRDRVDMMLTELARHYRLLFAAKRPPPSK